MKWEVDTNDIKDMFGEEKPAKQPTGVEQAQAERIADQNKPKTVVPVASPESYNKGAGPGPAAASKQKTNGEITSNGTEGKPIATAEKPENQPKATDITAGPDSKSQQQKTSPGRGQEPASPQRFANLSDKYTLLSKQA